MSLTNEKMAELNQTAMTLCGTDLVFTALGLSVKGMPGFYLQFLAKGEGAEDPFTIDSPRPEFRITGADFLTLKAAAEEEELSLEGLVFTLEDPAFTTTFTVEEVVPDLLGWIYLHCTLTDRGF